MKRTLPCVHHEKEATQNLETSENALSLSSGGGTGIREGPCHFFSLSIIQIFLVAVRNSIRGDFGSLEDNVFFF